MGYFANGSEGMQYQVKWCDRCINWRETEEGSENWGCPIIDLHMEWNYEQQGKGRPEIIKKYALHNFIEQNKDTFCDKCKMFFEKPDADMPGQMRLFESDKEPSNGKVQDDSGSS